SSSGRWMLTTVEWRNCHDEAAGAGNVVRFRDERRWGGGAGASPPGERFGAAAGGFDLRARTGVSGEDPGRERTLERPGRQGTGSGGFVRGGVSRARGGPERRSLRGGDPAGDRLYSFRAEFDQRL